MSDTPPALPGLASPHVLAMPERLVDSAWLGHIPFAMWLVGVHRPSSVVELGVHNGASFCAMVQAAKAVGLDARFHGVDHWQGDHQAGHYDNDVYWNLMSFHEARHADVSSLLCTGFDEASRMFEDGSLDLVHIDGLHTYEAVRHDFETWLPKMSRRGVILFHDTVETQGDFGVWKLWAEVSALYPSFNFSHSHGLGVLYVGSEGPPDWMASLAEGGSAEAGDRVRSYFNHLGDAVAARHALNGERAEAARLRAELAHLRDHAQRTDAALAASRRALASANEVVATQAVRIAAMRAQKAHDDARVASLSAQVSEDRGIQDAMRREVEAYRSELESLAGSAPSAVAPARSAA